MRLIDADEYKKVLCAGCRLNKSEMCEELMFSVCGSQCIQELLRMPTVDPVKHAHWIFANSDMSEKQIADAIQDFIDHGGDPKMWRIDTHYCSGCLTGYHIYDDGFIVDGKGYYCPHCGAKLDSNNTD